MTKTVVKLTAFLVVCLVFTGWLAFTIGNVKLFQRGYTLSAAFDDVTGLLPNDNVKVAGVPVGKVKSIKIRKGRAVVHFSVRDDVKVPTDSKVAIRWRNLLGQRYVYIYPGEASTTLPDGATITKTTSVVELGELFNRLGPIVKAIEPAKVNQFLDAIVAALDGNETKLRQSLADLAVLSKGLASRDEAIGRLIENVNTVAGAIDDRDAQIRTVLDNLLAITTTFNENTQVLDEATTQLSRFSDNLGTLLANNRSQIDNTIANLKKIVDVVQLKLPELDHALANLDEGAAALFRSSRYGEWLNQTIPCGRIGYGSPNLEFKDACIKGAQDIPPSPGNDSPAPQAKSGAAGLSDLIGSLAR